MFDALPLAASYLVNPTYWVAFSTALFLAVMVSVIPGISSIVVMAITLPFIIINVQDPVIGIIMLATIVGTNNTLDSVPAVLLGLPQSATQVTFLEGHQLARQGYAAHTLGAIFAVSMVGGVIGALALAITIPLIRPFVLSFSFGEIAVIALFGVAMVSVLSRGAMIKGLTAGAMGMFLGTVGAEFFTGSQRYIFGWFDLTEGLPVIAVITGLFALPEIIDLAVRGQSVSSTKEKLSQKEVWAGFMYGMRSWKVTTRQSLFGVAMGAIPGIGSGVIDWLSYAFGMVFTKDKSKVGKGWLEGVMFAESAQNAKESGQAIPTLALGIPGGLGWVLVIVAMLFYGISPGPQMLDRYAHLTIVIVITLALGNVAMTIIGLIAARQLTRLTIIPYAAIAATITPIVIMTAYIDFTGWIALPIVLIFAALGLVMKTYGWPRPPLVLGFILGPIIERNFWSGVSVHGLGTLLTRPLTIALFIAVIVIVVALNAAMAKASQTEAEITGQQRPTPIAGGSGQLQMPRITWHWANLVPLALCIAAIFAALEAMTFTTRGRPFPLYTSTAIAILSGWIFIRGFFESRAGGQIMDLGLASRGVSGAGQRAVLIFGLLALFMIMAMFVGLQWGALAFAFLTPVLLMNTRARWVAAAIAVAFVSFYIFFFAEYLMGVLWPNPALGQRFFGL